ncbi:c-type cytochrome domain-containing protein [Planctomycetaceae bacterium SH139]
MSRILRLILIFTVVAALPPTIVAAQAESAPSDVASLDARIAELKREAESLLEQAREVRKRAADQDRQWQGLLGQIESIADQRRQLESQRQQVAKAEAVQRAAEEKVKLAEQAFEAARKALEEAKQAATKAEMETIAAVKPIADMEIKLTELEPLLEPLKVAAKQAEGEALTLQKQFSNMEAQAASLKQQTIEQRQQIESILKQAGSWISFSDQIAPIFHDRCVACHNATNPQGRYSMSDYASILSAGESGLAIDPGDAEASPLYQYVVDGWMPFEADPLEPQQLTLIRDWIEQGARLDVAAEPDSPLIRIMPRITQPAPPQQYRAPLPITALAVDPKGGRLATSGYHEVLIWDLKSGQLSQRIANIAQRVYGVAFDSAGSRLAIASGTPGQLGEVKLFDSASGELINDLFISADAMFAVEFSPDGTRLAASGAEGTIVIFDLSSPARPQHLIEVHSDWVHSIAWSPDGKWLVSASRDKTSKVFIAETGELTLTFNGHQQNVTDAVFAADNQHVISGGDDQRLRIWNIKNGKQLKEIADLKANVGALRRLNERQLIVMTTAGGVSLYDVDEGERVQHVQLASEWLTSMAATGDVEPSNVEQANVEQGAAGESPSARLFIGDLSGRVFTVDCRDWTPGVMWTAVPGSQFSGANAAAAEGSEPDNSAQNGE